MKTRNCTVQLFKPSSESLLPEPSEAENQPACRAMESQSEKTAASSTGVGAGGGGVSCLLRILVYF